MTADQFYGLLSRAPVPREEMDRRGTERLARECQMDVDARSTPAPDDDD